MDTPNTPPAAPPVDAAALQAKIAELEGKVAAYAKQIKTAQALQKGYQALKAEGDPKIVAYFESRAMDRPTEYPRAEATTSPQTGSVEDLTPEQQEVRGLKAELGTLKDFFAEKFQTLLQAQQGFASKTAWDTAGAKLKDFGKYREKIAESLGGDESKVTDPKVIEMVYKAIRHDELESQAAKNGTADRLAAMGPSPSGLGAALPDLNAVKDPLDQFTLAWKGAARTQGITDADLAEAFGG